MNILNKFNVILYLFFSQFSDTKNYFLALLSDALEPGAKLTPTLLGNIEHYGKL